MKPIALAILSVLFVILLAACTQSPIDGAALEVTAFPGSNGKIAFHTDRDGNFEIYAMDADGTDPIRLTNDPKSEGAPVWNADGTKIAFVREIEGSDSDIFVMNADGSEKINLTNHSAPDGLPAWSPDGSEIAFVSWREGPARLFVMNADGTDQANISPPGLTNPGESDHEPAWSPDGSKIAFVRVLYENGSFQSDVFVMSANGTSPVNLTHHPSADGFPAWSPDGSEIAFVSWRDGNADIFVMEADGSSPVNLTNDPLEEVAPAWSPDGSTIAYERYGSGIYDVYAIGADGTNRIRLTVDAAHNGAPDWQPLRPQAATASLMEQVGDLELAKNADKSLLALLGEVQNSLAAGDTQQAINQLGAFINQVEALRGKKISVADADALIAYAESIIAVLKTV